MCGFCWGVLLTLWFCWVAFWGVCSRWCWGRGWFLWGSLVSGGGGSRGFRYLALVMGVLVLFGFFAFFWLAGFFALFSELGG